MAEKGKDAPAYTANYRREGDAWVVTFAELEAATWGRTLEQAFKSARESLAVTLDFDSVAELEAAVTVIDEVQLPGELGAVAQELRVERAEYEQAGQRLAARTAEAVERLRQGGLSMRDIGAALGVSHQRVGQLTAGKRYEPSRAGVKKWVSSTPVKAVKAGPRRKVSSK